MELHDHSVRELMQLYRQIGSELKGRNVCRTGNSPTGDIAEYLFAECFGWALERNSRAGYDATDPKRRPYSDKVAIFDCQQSIAPSGGHS